MSRVTTSYVAGYTMFFVGTWLLWEFAFPRAKMTHSTAVVLYPIAATTIAALAGVAVALANPLQPREYLARALSFVLLLSSLGSIAACVAAAITSDPHLRQEAIFALAPGFAYAAICLTALLA